MENRTNEETLMVEWTRQTQSEHKNMDEYEELFHNTQSSTLSKLENFAKHVRRQRVSRFLAHYEIYKQIINIHGSVLDLGSNAGQSLFTWAQISSILEPVNHFRRIIGFDTFEGFPNVEKEDFMSENPSERLKEGSYSFPDLDSIHAAIKAFDNNRSLGHIPKIDVVKGNVEETLPEYLEKNKHLIVSLLHLDMDIYKPTKIALETVYPRMPKGAIIVFDEIGEEAYPGETVALIDTLGIGNLKIQRFPWTTGLSYAIKD